MAEQTEIKVPDIGGASDVDVIDILIKIGDTIDLEQPLITLEGDKATMDIPSPAAGTVANILVKQGDKVSEGSPILILNDSANSSQSTNDKNKEHANRNDEPQQINKIEIDESASTRPDPLKGLPDEHSGFEVDATLPETTSKSSFISSSDPNEAALAASPAVRRMARELGVKLSDISGSGRKSRITKDDIQTYVKIRLSEPRGKGWGYDPAPSIDFSKFGPIEIKPLNKIKRLTGINVHRSWNTIPHVTQFDEADITELEAFRKQASSGSADYKLTLLAFVAKVVSKALQVYPQFNASLDPSGEKIIYKQYYHIGIAVDTPNGLVVPVIKNVDQLSVNNIAKEMTRLSHKAREKGLSPADMSGGVFTISSLGGIGGTAFTPIVNSPEVAILGLSRSRIKPVYEQGEWRPRLKLPLSLSYDHRAIDGAEAAHFTRFIAESLKDIRRILL